MVFLTRPLSPPVTQLIEIAERKGVLGVGDLALCFQYFTIVTGLVSDYISIKLNVNESLVITGQLGSHSRFRLLKWRKHQSKQIISIHTVWQSFDLFRSLKMKDTRINSLISDLFPNWQC